MKLYFLGIGGTAMGNLAIMMKSLGHEICGSDNKLYPPMSDLLSKSQISCFEGYDPLHIVEFQPDYVVVGNVMSRGNTEVEFLLNSRQFRCISLPQMIHDFIIKNRKSVVITGTHGKTTTTTLTSFLLTQNGFNPGFFIGGSPLNFDSGAYFGAQNSPFVIEGDEYDSAFFDKRSKFVHYQPHILIINNIELDHIDIFRDIEDIKRSFSHVIKLVPQNGCIIANGDSSIVRQLLPVPWTQTFFVGKNPDNDFIIDNERMLPSTTNFTLKSKEIAWKIKSPLLGDHNVRNVAMSVVASHFLSPDQEINVDFSGFLGIRKRQEILFNDGKVAVISDFAHHPTAIQETIRAIRQAFPDYQLITAFEPRSNSACSDCFQNQFASAFCGSDEVYISPVFKHQTAQTLNVQQITKNIQYCPAFSLTPEELKQTFTKKQLSSKTAFLLLSNGDFSGLPKHLADHFRHQ